MSRAVIYIRLAGALPAQQQRACLDYCDRHGYAVDSVCTAPAAAVALVEARAVIVVVTAHAGDDRLLARGVAAAGGRLEYARPPRGGRRIVDVAQLAAGMHERGASVDAIAHLLDATADDVRAAIRRAGLDPH
jgi:hypothetical protein